MIIQNSKFRIQNGFSLIEIIVVVAVLLTLLGLVSTSIFNLESRSSSSSTMEVLLSDLRNQQIKSMTGDTEGRGVPDVYSIYLSPSSYVLFHGQNYDPNDNTNFTVPIESGFQLINTFPNNKIVFAELSGEIVNFQNGQNSIQIREVRTGVSKTILFNKYGTITSIN